MSYFFTERPNRQELYCLDQYLILYRLPQLPLFDCLVTTGLQLARFQIHDMNQCKRKTCSSKTWLTVGVQLIRSLGNSCISRRISRALRRVHLHDLQNSEQPSMRSLGFNNRSSMSVSTFSWPYMLDLA